MSGDWNTALRVLCIRTDNMGDVLMSSPAIRALKNAVPHRHMALLASPSGAAIAAYLQGIDETIVYEAPWVKNDATDPADRDLAMIEQLRSRRFDAAVIFTTYSQSALPAALMCRLAGIPTVLAHSRENPYRLLSHWVPEGGPLDDGRHEVQRHLDLIGSIAVQTADTAMHVHVPESDRRSLAAKLSARGLQTGSGWIVLHPGATAASRRYPAQLFAQALCRLRPAVPVLLTGSASERALAQEVCESAGIGVNLGGELSLGELIAAIADADLLISNNSGPVHIAAASATPVVDLYALTNPQHTPWQVPNRVLNHDVPCRNCYRSICPQGHHACLLGVEPQRVADAARDLMAEEKRNVA